MSIPSDHDSTAASESMPQNLEPTASAALRAAGGQIPAKERGPSSAPRRAPVTRHASRRKSRGLSLVEQVMFIVIVGAAVAGVIGVIDFTTRSSADPMIHKQALAIAEAVLEEVQLQPFTYCDPDDPQATTALSAAVGATGCTAAASVENPGAEATPPYGPETRLSVTTPYDNVNDYNGFSMGPGIIDITSAAIAGLEAYTATVSVASQALGAIPATDALFITVTVTGPGNTTVTLNGYRTRYAPNDLP